jgi:hypothetical protein
MRALPTARIGLKRAFSLHGVSLKWTELSILATPS